MLLCVLCDMEQKDQPALSQAFDILMEWFHSAVCDKQHCMLL